MKKDAIVTHIQSATRRLMQQLGLLDSHTSPIKSISQSHALIEISIYKTMNMLQLARLLNLEQYTTSRLVMQLVSSGLCTIQRDAHDRRHKVISLTDKGSKLAQKIHKESHLQMQQALNLINKKERAIIAQGLSLYAQVLNQSLLKDECTIRKLLKKDKPQLQNLYKVIQTEYGLNAHHPIMSFIENESKEMYKTYITPRSGFFVIAHHATIVGMGGYSPLSETDPAICIIRSLYLSAPIRRLGLGTLLIQKILSHAKLNGFQRCYTEDYSSTQNPASFYTKLGFKKSDLPIFIQTKHNLKSQWYVKEL